MKTSNIGFNATVLANLFNPSVLRESWLLDQGVLTQGELQPGYMFSEQAAHVPTARYILVVVPQQLQFAPMTREGAGKVVRDVLIPIVDKLPHTPFTAVGVNFMWTLTPDGEDMATLSRRLFARDSLPLAADFADANAKFGLYMSKDVAPCRLKLNIRPVTVHTPPAAPQSAIHCVFNFHRDVAGDAPGSRVIEALDRWEEFDALAEQMAQSIVGAA